MHATTINERSHEFGREKGGLEERLWREEKRGNDVIL